MQRNVFSWLQPYFRGRIIERSFSTGRGRDRRDYLVTAVIPEAGVRVSAVRCGGVMEEASKRWEWPANSSLDWGRNAAHALLYSGFNLKGEERVKATLTGQTDNNEEAVRIFSEVVAAGEVRGSISNSRKTSMGMALTLERIRYGHYQPHTSSVESNEAGAGTDMVWQKFYDSSEQVPTCAVTMGRIASDDHAHEQRSSLLAGFAIQALPDADEQVHLGLNSVEWVRKEWSSGQLQQHFEEQVDTGLHALEDFLANCIAAPLVQPDVLRSQCLERQSNSTYSVTDGDSSVTLLLAVARRPVDFFCRCSRENFMKQLQLLPRVDLCEIERDGGCELRCQFCNTVYEISRAEVALVVDNE